MGCALAERQSKRGQHCAQFLRVRGDRPAHVEQRLSARWTIYRRFKSQIMRNAMIQSLLLYLLFWWLLGPLGNFGYGYRHSFFTSRGA